MSHWAELDENNVVLRVTVGDNNDPTEGYDWLMTYMPGKWLKCSYNGNIRARFAGIGYTYDEQRDVFIAPQPFPSWVLNETTTEWEAPVLMPTEGGPWIWDEATLDWIAVSME